MKLKNFKNMKIYQVIAIFACGLIASILFSSAPTIFKQEKIIPQSQNDYINLVNENLRLKENDSIQKKEITQIKRELANIRNQMNSWVEFKKEVDSFKREYEGSDPL